jgi:hypothetical protein
MIFFFSATFHLILLFSARKILNIYLKGAFNSYQYFLVFSILGIISFFVFLLNAYIFLITIKIILTLFFFYYLFYYKSKNFDYFDIIFLLIGIALIFFSYGKMFAKTDVFISHGVIAKDIFFTKLNPIISEYSSITNKHYSGLMPSLQNFFLSGFNNFREDTCIYINNLYIFSSALIFFPDKIKKSKNNNLLLFLVLSIFYLIFNLFGQGFQNVFSDDLGYALIGSLLVFIAKYNMKEKYSNRIVFLLMTLTILNKESMIYFILIFILFNICKNFFCEKKLGFKFIFYSVLLFFLLNTLQSVQRLNHATYINKYKIMNLTNIENLSLDKPDHRLFFNKEMNIDNLLHYGLYSKYEIINRNIIRAYVIKNDPIIRKSAYNILKKILTIEVYKASILPTYRYTQTKFKNLPYLPKIGINIIFWYPVLALILFFIERSESKNIKVHFFKKYFNTIFFIFACGMSIILNLENNFQSLEKFSFKNGVLENYSLNCSDYNNCIITRDYGRYLGWPINIICFVILYKIVNLNTDIIKIKKYLSAILIFTMCVSPARSFAYLYGYSDGTASRISKISNEKKYVIPVEIINKCQAQTIGLLYAKNFHDIHLFKYSNVPYLIHAIYYQPEKGYDYNIITNLMNCLIITKESYYLKNDWTLNNFDPLYENELLTFYVKTNK